MKTNNTALNFDSGIREYSVNGAAVLRFNPSDPNLYHRFKRLDVDIAELEKEVAERSKTLQDGREGIDLLKEYDGRVKDLLAGVFGAGNDFDAIFSGLNVMAIAGNGELIITNFLNSLRPIIEEGVSAYAKMEAQKAVQRANAERAER